MTADYPVDDAPATPEYVFHLFRQVGLMLSGADAPAVTFDAVADEPADRVFGRPAFHLLDVLDQHLGVDVPLHDLDAALHPLSRHTVREVCEFLAPRITRPTIRPWRHIAGECLPAGAFLTARSLLARVGADPDEIAPSTPLEPHLPELAGEVGEWLVRLAPGRLPTVRIDYPP